jgi:MFS transporter, DHA1 family, multidrug resistance protein
MGIEVGSFFVVTQSIFTYIPLSYPSYSASIFAANSFSRSILAFGAVVIAHPFFSTLKVSAGVSLLAGLAVGCVGRISVLYVYGGRLRARSRFAVS